MVKLRELRDALDRQEETRLSAYAARSTQAIRRRFEERIAQGHRQEYTRVRVDKITHGKKGSED